MRPESIRLAELSMVLIIQGVERNNYQFCYILLNERNCELR